METKGHLKTVKALGVYVLIFFLFFDKWTGAGEVIDDYLYQAYLGETWLGTLLRWFGVIGFWALVCEMVGEIKWQRSTKSN